MSDQVLEIELRKLELEKHRIQTDAELRKADINERAAAREWEERKQSGLNELRRFELNAASGRGIHFTAAQATIAAAALALIGGALGAAFQAWSARDSETIKAQSAIDLQRQQFQATLIQGAIRSENLGDRIANLRFFLEAGLIDDRDGKLAKLIKNQLVPGPLVSTPNSNQAMCSALDHWTYSQSTGILCHAGQLVGFGYSGRDSGRNNPGAQDKPLIGPIPRGIYKVTSMVDSPTTGIASLALEPDPQNTMFGRSGFRIHGDSANSPGNASSGAIVLPSNVRVLIGNSPDKVLEVIQ